MRYRKNTNLRIEEGVPRREPWPFSSLKPGDSFAVSTSEDDSVERYRARATAWSAAKRYMKAHPAIKLTVGVDPDRNFRCWRTE